MPEVVLEGVGSEKGAEGEVGDVVDGKEVYGQEGLGEQRAGEPSGEM